MLPSLQGVASATTVLKQVPPLQVSDVHGFPSLQSAATLHALQPGTGVWTHPEMPLHVSVVQLLPSLQLRAVPGEQTPLWQTSTPLQRFPSLHVVPLGSTLCWQPVTGSQLSVVQAFPSLQSSGLPGMQLPP